MKELYTVLYYARDLMCSDVHISVGSDIMIRKNGTLETYFKSYSNDEQLKMIYSMINDEQRESLKKHKDLDFVFVDERNERYRVNVYLQQNRLTAAIRIIHNVIRSLDELHMPDILKQITNEPRGLVLLTGPTGSGKSTTLAAMIQYINEHRNCHILTIEDPIEYVYQQKQALIHQREIHDDVESFDVALRSAMREDPDVILVGEMRDYETIAAVITLAETGHLVFSTLHTIGAAKTIDRIIDVFPPHRQQQIRLQLCGVLNMIVTQQLLPLQNQGGRVAALEILVANDAIKNMIRENKVHQINSMLQTGSNEGMMTLNSSLAKLVRSNQVSQQVAEKFSDDVDELKQYLLNF